MLAYIFKRLLLVPITLLAIIMVNFIVIQFAPGGPVEQTIAKIQGVGIDATARISGSGSGDSVVNKNQSQSAKKDGNASSVYRGARGLDPELIKEIERSLQSANLGFSISNDGNIIRAIAPPFTEERRRDYVKQIKKIGEDTKIALRNIRRDCNDQLKQMEKGKQISQDDEKNTQESIQKVTDLHTNLVDDLMTAKEKELLTL